MWIPLSCNTHQGMPHNNQDFQFPMWTLHITDQFNHHMEQGFHPGSMWLHQSRPQDVSLCHLAKTSACKLSLEEARILVKKSPILTTQYSLQINTSTSYPSRGLCLVGSDPLLILTMWPSELGLGGLLIGQDPENIVAITGYQHKTGFIYLLYKKNYLANLDIWSTR